MADLYTNVRFIKGIGEQRAKALGKLGIETLGISSAGSPVNTTTAPRQNASPI